MHEATLTDLKVLDLERFCKSIHCGWQEVPLSTVGVGKMADFGGIYGEKNAPFTFEEVNLASERRL